MQFISDGYKMCFAPDDNGLFIFNGALVTRFSCEFLNNYIDITSINDSYIKKIPTTKSILLNLEIQGSHYEYIKDKKIDLPKQIFNKAIKVFENELRRKISL